jgi:hypothetical protein
LRFGQWLVLTEGNNGSEQHTQADKFGYTAVHSGAPCNTRLFCLLYLSGAMNRGVLT